jgi:putative transposase
MHHYNTPGHAHELTFSTYRRQPYLSDPVVCKILFENMEKSRSIYNFRLWAYVLMPHHVHMLIWPLDNLYDIGKIESGIKGVMSKRYRKYLLENRNDIYESFLFKNENEKEFIFWQRGGGFDRNLWNAKAIHDSINYIEANPVRSRFVTSPELWQWSSAFSREHNVGVIPDVFSMPVAMPNPQHQRLGVV